MLQLKFPCASLIKQKHYLFLSSASRPASNPMGTGGYFSWGKAARREATSHFHPVPRSRMVGLYLHSPNRTFMHVTTAILRLKKTTIHPNKRLHMWRIYLWPQVTLRCEKMNRQIWDGFITKPTNQSRTRVYFLQLRLYQYRSQEAKCRRVWDSFWEASLRLARELSATITRSILNAWQPCDRTNYTHFQFHSNSALVCHSTPARTVQISNIRTTQYMQCRHPTYESTSSA
jgi:hypothetical protein